MIDKARSQGYKLVTVGNCLGDPESNWYRDTKSGNAVNDSLIRNAADNPSSVEEKGEDVSRNKDIQPGGQSGRVTTQTPQTESAAANSGDDGSPTHENGAATSLGKHTALGMIFLFCFYALCNGMLR